MIWIYAEDSYFYDTKENYSLLRKKIAFSNKDLAIHLDNLEKKGSLNFELVFDSSDVKEIFKNKEKRDSIILSPFTPKSLNIETSFFGVFKV